MIIRRVRNRDFTVVANALFRLVEAEKLSFEALGLAIFLLSKPNQWRINLYHLARLGRIGRDRIRRLARELIEVGLLSREHMREPGTNAFAGIDYVLRDEPEVATGEREPEKPSAEKPAPEKPAPGKPSAVVNTEYQKELKEVERKARAREAKIPDEELLDRLKAKHPNASHDSPVAIDAAWCALTRAERREAVDRFDNWFGERGARKAIAGLPAYLGEKRFTMVKVAVRPTGSKAAFCGAFDRTWWFLFFDFVERHRHEFKDRDSPAAALLRRRVSFTRQYGGGWPLEGHEAPVERAAATMRSINAGSDDCRRWRELLAAFGVQLPLPDKLEWIFVPNDEWVASGRVDGLNDRGAGE